MRRKLQLPAVLGVVLTCVAAGESPSPLDFPTGGEAAAQMTVPPGFEVQLFAAEPDVVNPIGVDFDHRGRVFVLECLEYPRKAPAEQKGRDRVRILEDTDGDGAADKATIFADGLNLATGIAVGHGGVFVGEAPELVFLEDTDGDDRADRRTVLLDGWGFQDTHETLNSFLWGPDGWLYGCHGVFTHSEVRGIKFSAAIWRYHPQTKEFEIFAEGTSNPWGFDYDENGSSFLTACVIPHLFHMVPGGLYIRQAGQNRNPHAYGQIKEISDHRHFRPGGYRGSIDETTFGGGHAHAGCLVYQGGAFPEEYHGRVFMSNIHGSRINMDIFSRNGSTFVGSHGPDFLLANDPRFRAVQLRTGPDGSIYALDWYDPQICHNPDPNVWDREHGRVYKIVYKGADAVAAPNPTAGAGGPVGDLNERSSRELVGLLAHRNSWWWRKALLILDERGDRSVVPALERLVRDADDYRVSLRALWALYNIEAFDEDLGRDVLGHANSWLRAWAVRLLGQLDSDPSPDTWSALVNLARTDPSADVRLQLASSCQRWRAVRDPSDLLEALMARDEDADDPTIPLMIWIAYEPGVVAHSERVLDFLAAHAADHPVARDAIVPRALRRLVATGEERHLDAAVAFLGRVKGGPARAAGLDGLLEALRGRRLEPPESWAAVYPPLLRAENTGVVGRARRLGIHFGDRRAVAAAERAVRDTKLPARERIEAVRSLALARAPGSVEPLLVLVASGSSAKLKREALRALAGFQSDRVPETVLAQWADLPPSLKTEAVGLLSGRNAWAQSLLAAIEAGTVAREDLTSGDVRRILAHGDDALTERVESIWGKLRAQTPEHVEQQLARFRRQLAELPGDRRAGRAVFEKNCMVCHVLNGEGSKVGPDITGANRRDPEYLLENILDPNRVVGRDYYSATAVDTSGRVHTGLVAEDTPQRVALTGENAKLTVLPRSDIEELRIEEKSLMPEGLPEKMSEQEFRDLIAYLIEDPHIDRGLVAGPFVAPLTLDHAFPVEQASNPLEAADANWRPFRLGPTATIDLFKLNAMQPAANSGAYVYAEVRSDGAQSAAIEVSGEDAVKMWVNGKEVDRRENARRPRRVPVDFRDGVNRLLFKVTNFYGPARITARLIDPQRRLEVLQPRSVERAARSGR